MVTPGCRHSHERFRHEARDEVVLACDLGTDLSVRGEAVSGAQRVVEHEVELELTRRVLVVALNHVEAHRPRILDGPQVHGTQALELVDVVAVRIRESAVGLAVRSALEPHHLRLGAVTQVQAAVLGLELVVDAAQVAAAVRGQECARIPALFAVAEQRAPQPSHALVPGELAEGLDFRDADKLLVLRAVAEVLAVPVHEEIDRRAVDELEPSLRDALPVVGGDALAADAAGNRYKLQIQVLDAELVDLLSDMPDHFGPSGRFHEAFDVHRHSSGLLGLIVRRHRLPPQRSERGRGAARRFGSSISPRARAWHERSSAILAVTVHGDGNHDQLNTKTQPIIPIGTHDVQ